MNSLHVFLAAYRFNSGQKELLIIECKLVEVSKMKRATIITKGDVQRVGHRDVVEKIARKLKLTGFVENLKPYDVKIVTEGEEDTLDEFITRIRIDEPPVSVEGIDVEFGAATGEFEYFEIRRGDWKEELGECMDTAGAMLYMSVRLGERSVEIGEKMLDKQDTTIQILKDVKDDTSQIKGIKEDTKVMKDKLTSIEAIHKELLDLKVLYNQLSEDITEIKIAISELSESGVGAHA